MVSLSRGRGFLSGRWLITGASGRLGSWVVQQLLELSVPAESIFAYGHSNCQPIGDVQILPLNLSDPNAIQEACQLSSPSWVIHLGGETSVAGAYENPRQATSLNVDSTRYLYEATREWDSWMLFASTDMVHDGSSAPYVESDATSAVSLYGKSKVAGERVLLDADNAAIARFSLMLGPSPSPYDSQFKNWLAQLGRGEKQNLFVDEWRTAISYERAAKAVICLASQKECGLWNISGDQSRSRYQLIQDFAKTCKIDAQLSPLRRADVKSPEARPEDLSLANKKLKKHFPDLFQKSEAQEYLQWLELLK